MTGEGERLTRTLHAELARWFKDAATLEGKGAKIPAATLRRRMQSISWHLKAIARAEGMDLDATTPPKETLEEIVKLLPNPENEK